MSFPDSKHSTRKAKVTLFAVRDLTWPCIFDRSITKMSYTKRIAFSFIISIWITAFTLVAGAQEVNGIYTDSTTKDLGDITKVDALKGIKFRGWVEGYYVVNFNHLNKDAANANQGSSAIQSRDLTIEGRT